MDGYQIIVSGGNTYKGGWGKYMQRTSYSTILLMSLSIFILVRRFFVTAIQNGCMAINNFVSVFTVSIFKNYSGKPV